MPAPVPRHQRVSRELLGVLIDQTRRHGGEVLASPLDIVFSEFNVLQPDLVVFAVGREHCIRPDEAIRHPPDLAIEILSPSTAMTDRGPKMQMLARYGVPEYWVVDPRAMRIEVYWLREGSFELAQTALVDDVVRSTLLVGLAFPAARIFPF